METEAKHTPLREALMRAWVAGWIAGVIGDSNDDGKRDAAQAIARQFPTEDAAPDLLEALRECITDDGAYCFQRNDRGATLRRRLDNITITARAAIAQAEKGA